MEPVSTYNSKAVEIIDITFSTYDSPRRTFLVAGKIRQAVMERALPLHEAGNLIGVMESIHGDNTKVGRMIDGRIFIGEARCFVSSPDCTLNAGEDVRDLFLRVTLDAGGGDAFWLVSDLMADYASGYFVTHYEVPAVL